jgi:hypothetical protein
MAIASRSPWFADTPPTIVIARHLNFFRASRAFATSTSTTAA